MCTGMTKQSTQWGNFTYQVSLLFVWSGSCFIVICLFPANLSNVYNIYINVLTNCCNCFILIGLLRSSLRPLISRFLKRRSCTQIFSKGCIKYVSKIVINTVHFSVVWTNCFRYCSNFLRIWYQGKFIFFSLHLVNFTPEKGIVWKIWLVIVTIVKLTQ